MTRNKQHWFYLPLSAVLLLAGLGVAAVQADDDEGEHVRMTASDPAWKEECGSCHIAYPPRLLPASSWRELMSGLDKHFGSDASLDKKTADQITAFLERNAGRERASRKSSTLRITDTRWFRHEHDEISQRTWNNPKVKGASNCEACHAGAANGDFSEHRVRIPR